MTTHILWVSRHAPLPDQVRDLEHHFGAISITRKDETITNVKKLIKEFQLMKYDQMVVVLPSDMIQQIIEAGIKPLKAIMRREKQSDGSYWFFHDRYVRLTKVEVECEEL